MSENFPVPRTRQELQPVNLDHPRQKIGPIIDVRPGKVDDVGRNRIAAGEATPRVDAQFDGSQGLEVGHRTGVETRLSGVLGKI